MYLSIIYCAHQYKLTIYTPNKWHVANNFLCQNVIKGREWKRCNNYALDFHNAIDILKCFTSICCTPGLWTNLMKTEGRRCTTRKERDVCLLVSKPSEEHTNNCKNKISPPKPKMHAVCVDRDVVWVVSWIQAVAAARSMPMPSGLVDHRHSVAVLSLPPSLALSRRRSCMLLRRKKRARRKGTRHGTVQGLRHERWDAHWGALGDRSGSDWRRLQVRYSDKWSVPDQSTRHAWWTAMMVLPASSGRTDIIRVCCGG